MKKLRNLFLYTAILSILSLFVLIFRNFSIAADMALFSAINGLSSPLFDIIFIPFTYYGSVFFWCFLIIFSWIKKERKLSLKLFYNLIISSFLSITLKWIFQRSRPEGIIKYFILSENDVGKSFPSGHSQNAFSGSVILSSFHKHKLLFYGTALMTAMSRVYIGAHYPLDILFGALIGLIIGDIAVNIPTEKAQKKAEKYIKKTKAILRLKN